MSDTMNYVDGFVVAVPRENKQKYLEVCNKAANFFKECGAIRVVECWGDDVPVGEVTDFHRAVQAKDNEVILFSWIEWPSKQLRDEGIRRMESDPRMQKDNMPFDGQRMIFGGFVPIFNSYLQTSGTKERSIADEQQARTS